MVTLKVKDLLAMRETSVDPWVRKIPWRREFATNSSINIWGILWTKEPGEL